MNVYISMKKKPLIRIKTIHNFAAILNSRRSIFGSFYIMLLASVILLNACGQGSTNNYYSNPEKSGSTQFDSSMSGGGGGTGDGGGGQGVQCGNTSDSRLRNQLFVRDIFEAISNHGRVMKTVSAQNPDDRDISEEAIDMLIKSIVQYLGPASVTLDFAQSSFWKDFSNRISFVGEDKELFPSKDANSPIALPKSCNIVQIAYWDESPGMSEDGTLYVSKQLWEKLDQFNKIALLAHEYFFKQARKAKFRNSDLTRYKIGQLLSKEGLQPLFKNWEPSLDLRAKNFLPKSRKGFKLCEGTSAEDSTAKIQLVQYEGQAKTQHLVFPLISSKSINTNPLTPNNFSIIPEKNSIFIEGTDLLLFQSKFKDASDTSMYGLTVHDWSKWWFDNNGMLSMRKNGHLPDFNKKLLSTVTRIGGAADVWRGHIETPQTPIQVVIQNPLRGPLLERTESKMKSKEDLINTTHEIVKTSIINCGIIQVPGQIYAAAIAKLNSDVDDAIRSGTYPNDGFPNWILSLKKFEQYVKTQEQLEADGNQITKETLQKQLCSFSQYDQLVNKVPYMLYNLKLNNYSSSEIRTIFQDSGFYPKPLAEIVPMQSLPLGKVTISQDQTTLTFDLKCKDYSEVYSKIVGPYKGGRVDFSPNSNINAIYGERSQADIDDKYGTSPETLRFLTRYFAVNDPALNESYSAFSKCLNLRRMRDQSCDDYDQFSFELKNESTITADFCGNHGFRDEDTETFGCAIIKMNGTQNSYIIRFLHSDNWENSAGVALKYPIILFLRRVPNL